MKYTNRNIHFANLVENYFVARSNAIDPTHVPYYADTRYQDFEVAQVPEVETEKAKFSMKKLIKTIGLCFIKASIAQNTLSAPYAKENYSYVNMDLEQIEKAITPADGISLAEKFKLNFVKALVLQNALTRNYGFADNYSYKDLSYKELQNAIG